MSDELYVSFFRLSVFCRTTRRRAPLLPRRRLITQRATLG